MAKKADSSTSVSSHNDKQESIKSEVIPHSEGWVVKHSKSRDGKAYYYNTVTGVSTWKKPHDYHSHSAPDAQGKFKNEEKVKLKDKKKNSPDMNQSGLSLILMHYTKQKNKDPSGHSQKRKAEKVAALEVSSIKVVKSSNISTVSKVSISEYRRSDKMNAPAKQSNEPGTIHTLVKKQIVETYSGDDTKCKEHKVNKKATKRPCTSLEVPTSSEAVKETQNSFTTAVEKTTPKLIIAKAKRRKQKNIFLADDAQNISCTSGAVNKVVPGIHREKIRKKIRINLGVPISSHLVNDGVDSKRKKVNNEPVKLDEFICKDTVNKPINSSQRSILHQYFSKLVAKDIKKVDRSDLSSYENLLPQQPPCYKNDLVHGKESHCQNSSCSSRGRNTLPSQTTSNRVACYHSLENSSPSNKNESPQHWDDSIVNKESQSNNKSVISSNLSRLSDLDVWHHSPLNDRWKVGIESNVKDVLNTELNNLTRQQPSPNNTDVEQDIEDMEVDEEGLGSFSNQRDVLTETVTETKPSSPAIAASFTQTTKYKIILVVDTNVLINHLRFLRDVLTYNIPGHGDSMMVLPWVVIQELDHLKNGKGSLNNLSISTSQKAAKAVRFIHSNLVDKNPQLVGQTPAEANEETELSVQCNDDRILQCTLQCERKYKGSQIVLLTGDMNLINKAMIMGIKAANNETLWSRLKVRKPNFGKRQTSFEERNSTAEISHTSIISLNSTDIIELSQPKLRRQNTEDDRFQKSQKTDTMKVLRDSSATTPRSTTVTADTSLLEKASPTESTESSRTQATIDHKRTPQTEAEKSVVMNKFQAVWNLIFDIKSQIGTVLADGNSHVNYSEAVQILPVIIPLLSALKDDFDRCLCLSPIILWEHEDEFNSLCIHLNTFFAQAQAACIDPSQPVEAFQLLKHFCERENRPLLLAGLEQLSTFLMDIEGMLKQCS